MAEQPVLIDNEHGGPGTLTLLCNGGWHTVGTGKLLLECRAHDATLAELNRRYGDTAFRVRVARSDKGVPEEYSSVPFTPAAPPNASLSNLASDRFQQVAAHRPGPPEGEGVPGPGTKDDRKPAHSVITAPGKLQEEGTGVVVDEVPLDEIKPKVKETK